MGHHTPEEGYDDEFYTIPESVPTRHSRGFLRFNKEPRNLPTSQMRAPKRIKRMNDVAYYMQYTLVHLFNLN